jgi:phage terminase large subunit-like protein
MTDAAREAICRRRLAGESVGELAAEVGCVPATIYAWGRKFGLRLCDHPDAVRPIKGPAPLVVALSRDADGAAVVEARRGEVTITVPFDPDRPGDTARRLMQVAEGRFNAGQPLAAMLMLSIAQRVLCVALGIRTDEDQRRERRAATRAAWMAEREAKKRRLRLERGENVSGLVLRPAQTPPEGEWRTWLFLGGRGAGKTLAGANWLADQAERLGEGGRLALIGPTLHDVREVMIEGVSGVRNLPRWTDATRPVFEPSRRRVRFYGGCEAYTFSAEEPDRLRGPQFAAAWADEFCAWPKGEETLALLRMGLRLPGPAPFPLDGGRVGVGGGGRLSEEAARVARTGDGATGAELSPSVRSPPPQPSPIEGEGAGSLPPRLVVTTTPRPTRALIGLRNEASCVQTHAGTEENAAHLADGFVEGLRALYGGTRREAQELDGRVVDLDGALFTAEMMAGARCPSPLGGEGGPTGPDEGAAGSGAQLSGDHPDDRAPSSVSLREPPSPPRGEGSLDRIVVAIDPTATLGGDACGIVAAGSRVRADRRREAVVLADRSARGLSPDGWARRALALAAEVGAGAIVAEVNQGGDMVAQVLKAAGCSLKVREVRATRGKRIRAEPVAALYEQGRVKHAGAFGPLEEELMAMGAESEPAGSLDRADALVWAITDLLIDGPDGDFGPRMRRV